MWECREAADITFECPLLLVMINSLLILGVISLFTNGPVHVSSFEFYSRKTLNFQVNRDGFLSNPRLL
jgi:hypothetical protein